MKKLLIFISILLFTTSIQAQTFIRAHTLSYGVKHKTHDNNYSVEWIVEFKPENILIVITKGLITINSQKVQHFHTINLLQKEKGFIAYSCRDNDNKDCIVFLQTDEQDQNYGCLAVDYDDVIYYYYSSLEK